MDCPATSLLPATLLHRLAQAPEHCALRYQQQSYSNADLLHKVNGIAAALLACEVNMGDAVAVVMPRCPELLATLLALWQCGAIYVPLDPYLPRERLQQQLEGASVRLLLTISAHCDAMARLPFPLMEITPLRRNLDSTLAPVLPHLLTDNTPAYIMFTSGSSGPPKAVLLSHGNVATFFAAVEQIWNFKAELRFLGVAAPGFDISIFELLAPLLFGGTLILADDETGKDSTLLLQLIAEEQVDVVQATPSRWQLLSQSTWPASLRLSLILSIGEALRKPLVARLLQHCDAMWNLYGPTEATVWATAHPISAEDISEEAPAIISIGQALPGYHTTITNTGELLLSGSAVAMGYANDAALSAARFVAVDDERCYHTGDLCRRDVKGNLHFLGRHDQQVKVDGHRIELEEIEQRLQEHNSVAQAACAVRTLQNGNNQLLAFLVCKHGTPNKDAQRFNAWLTLTLPGWMLPHRYFIVDRLPLTPNGKLDRRALLALAEQNKDTDPTVLTPLAQTVASLFCEILELPSVGLNDSFFDLGGTSMLSATLVLSLNQRFHTRLSLREVLQTPPTVQRFVQLLQAQGIEQ